MLEKSQILEALTQDSDNVRVAPDPIAEHLVARLRTEELKGDLKAWRNFVGKLRGVGSPSGFVSALAACAKDEVYGSRIPPIICEQIIALRDGGEHTQTAA